MARGPDRKAPYLEDDTMRGPDSKAPCPGKRPRPFPPTLEDALCL